MYPFDRFNVVNATVDTNASQRKMYGLSLVVGLAGKMPFYNHEEKKETRFVTLQLAAAAHFKHLASFAQKAGDAAVCLPYTHQ